MTWVATTGFSISIKLYTSPQSVDNVNARILSTFVPKDRFVFNHLVVIVEILNSLYFRMLERLASVLLLSRYNWSGVQLSFLPVVEKSK